MSDLDSSRRNGKYIPTKQEESKIGADIDIEFWIIQEELSLSFLFQAKQLINDDKSHRSKFTYRDGANSQINTLIRHAEINDKFPAYLLYGYHEHEACFQGALYIKDAYSAKQDFITNAKNNEGLSRATILEQSNPFHDLFCNNFGFPANKEAFIARLEELFPGQKESYERAIKTQIPPYVKESKDTGSLKEPPPELKTIKFLAVLDLEKRLNITD
jgi:hypothetical protein